MLSGNHDSNPCTFIFCNKIACSPPGLAVTGKFLYNMTIAFVGAQAITGYQSVAIFLEEKGMHHLIFK